MPLDFEPHVPVPGGAGEDVGVAGAAGTGIPYAREDHVHNIAGQAGEAKIALHLIDYLTIGQGTWAWAVNAAHPLCGYWANTSNADADNLEYGVYLAKGTYRICTWHGTGPSLGILKVDIDGVTKQTIDCYSAGWVIGVRTVEAAIAIATAGFFPVTVKLDGKNGASTGHNTMTNSIMLSRSA